VRIFLAPPKNPHSTSARDRRWILNLADIQRGQGQVVELYGTREGDPKGAKAEANRVLGHRFAWVTRGHGGYEAKVPKHLQDSPTTDLHLNQ
jgi:hypothetical protein